MNTANGEHRIVLATVLGPTTTKLRLVAYSMTPLDKFACETRGTGNYHRGPWQRGGVPTVYNKYLSHSFSVSSGVATKRARASTPHVNVHNNEQG